MCNGNLKCELVTFADAVRTESEFDIEMDINIPNFFRVKFDNDEIERDKLCKALYKYTVNG